MLSTISVVVPCHNHGQYLMEAVDSVIAQTWQPDEIILIDDGSTDDSWEIMRSYLDEHTHVEAFRYPKAPCVAEVLNRSIRLASGDVWVWAPADDVLAPDLLETKLELSKNCGHQAVIYSDWEIIGPEGKHRDWRRLPSRTQEEFRACVWETSPIGFTGIWIPMAIFDQVGTFASHSLSEDFQWMIRATIHGIPFVHCPHVLYKKRRNPQQTSARKTEKILEMVPMIRKELAVYREVYNRMLRP